MIMLDVRILSIGILLDKETKQALRIFAINAGLRRAPSYCVGRYGLKTFGEPLNVGLVNELRVLL